MDSLIPRLPSFGGGVWERDCTRACMGGFDHVRTLMTRSEKEGRIMALSLSEQ